MRDNFAAFILTHGRPDNIKTLKTLNRCGYTGKIYFIVDNEDKTIDRYIRNFGSEKVIVFDKKAIADTVDEGNNFDDRRTTTHARNACFGIAKDLGIIDFIQLDDDYVNFHFRWISKDGKKLLSKEPTDLNIVFNIYLEFFKAGNFKSLAMAQGGDFMGGIENIYVQKMPLIRKCMNSFFCSTERPFQFLMAQNEDVNTYILHGSRGELFGTAPVCSLVQTATQKNKGTISDQYILRGTYIKSFYTVMIHPSSVYVSMLNSKHIRLHHLVKWINTVPVIIGEKWKK